MANVVYGIRARDETGGAFRSIRSSVLGIGAVAGAAAAVVGGVTAVAVRGAASFDGALREINTLVGLEEEQLQQFGKDLRALAIETGADVGDLAEGAYRAISARVPFEEVLDFLRTANETAVAGGTDLATAVQTLASVVNAYGSDVLSAEQASDILFTTVKQGQVRFEDLAAVIGNVAPLAAQSGISFAEVGASFAAITAQGVPATQAATQLRAVIFALIRPSSEAADIFRRFDFSPFMSLREGGLNQALADFNTLLQNSEDPMQALSLLVNQEALPGFLNLGIFDLTDSIFYSSLQETENAAGATKTAFDEMSKAATTQWEQAINRLQAALLPLGQEILPVINGGLAAFNKWIIDNEGPITEAFENIGSVMGDALGTLGTALGALVTGDFPTFRREISGFFLDIADTAVTGISFLLTSTAPYWLAAGAQATILMAEGIFKGYAQLPQAAQALVGTALGAYVGLRTTGTPLGAAIGGSIGGISALIAGELADSAVVRNLFTAARREFSVSNFQNAGLALGGGLRQTYSSSQVRADLLAASGRPYYSLGSTPPNPYDAALYPAGFEPGGGGRTVIVNINGDILGDADDTQRAADSFGSAALRYADEVFVQ